MITVYYNNHHHFINRQFTFEILSSGNIFYICFYSHGTNKYLYYQYDEKFISSFSHFSDISIYDYEFEIIRNFVHKNLFLESYPIDVYKSFVFAEILLNSKKLLVSSL